MPYPSKTDRKTILSAAVKDLAHGGIRDLSLRNLAASLDLAPNAIYRYFSDRSTLEAALANEAARQLELALRKAADACEPVTTIRKMSSAYIKFARDNRHLYEVMRVSTRRSTMRPPDKASGRSPSSRCNELPGRTELRRRCRALGIPPWSRGVRSRASVRREQTCKRP